jgi:hypothetical protein
MRTYRTAATLTLLSIMVASVAVAQTAPPQNSSSTTHGSMASNKAMQDCMTKEKAKNSTTSKADMKKACTSQMNSSPAQSKNQ